MTQWLKHGWHVISKRADWVSLVAVLLILLGLVLLFGTKLPQAIGGIVLGAGLSALVGAVTGRTAVSRESARQANLDRKRMVYGPLYAELKALRILFEEVKTGAAPAPRWIDTGEPPPRGCIPPAPTMRLWPEFKQDYHDTDFTKVTQRLLDDLQASVDRYAGALTVARDPAISYVEASLNEAIDVLRKSDRYKRWQRADAERRAQSLPEGHAPKLDDDWYGFIDSMEVSAPALKKTVGRVIAETWFTAWPASSEAATLGWLLGRRPDKAAAYVRNKYSDNMSNPPPPFEWIFGIFEDAWPAIERDPEFRAAGNIKDDLVAEVQEAERVLEAGLRRIQERYEGGEPLV